MHNPSRRAFVITVAASGSGLAATRSMAQAVPSGLPMLAETDPQAAALGYKADASKVDKAKYPQRTTAQICNGCNFFQGTPADASAPCMLIPGKQVAGKGWCSAWAKKA